MKESDFKEVDISSLIELFNRYKIDELNLEDNGVKLELKRDLPLKMRKTQLYTNIPNNPIVNQPVDYKKDLSKKDLTKNSVKDSKEENNYFKITSPMAGTFYQAASPTDKPYAKVGSNISSNSVICIIEAMKMMNEIKAEVKGKIVKILVEDGKPVLAGTVLFWVDKD